jgi:hypothetical protein
VSSISRASLIDPLTPALSPKGERGKYFVGAFAASLLFLLFVPSAVAQQAYSVSVKPPDLAPEERVAGFWLEVSGGSIRALLALPAGWVINIDNLTGHTSIQGTLQEGAAAMDPGFFRDFMLVEEDAHPIALFALQGELILTGDAFDTAYDGRHVPLIGDQFVLKPVP